MEVERNGTALLVDIDNSANPLLFDDSGNGYESVSDKINHNTHEDKIEIYNYELTWNDVEDGVLDSE